LDEFENMHCVVAGEKIFHLMHHHDSAEVLTVANGWHAASNTSQIDVRDVNVTRFPAFASAPHFACVVAAGDCIYLPRLMLHQVNAAASRSVSVNVWWRRVEAFDASVSVESHPALSTLHFHQFLASPRDEL
jgi:hypothetical protein